MRKRQDTNNTSDPSLCQGLGKGFFFFYYISYKYSASSLPTGRKLGLRESEVTERVDGSVQIGAPFRLTSLPPLWSFKEPQMLMPRTPPSLPETKPRGMAAGPLSDFPALHPTCPSEAPAAS